LAGKSIDWRNTWWASSLIMMHSDTCQERFQWASSVNLPWHARWSHWNHYVSIMQIFYEESYTWKDETLATRCSLWSSWAFKVICTSIIWILGQMQQEPIGADWNPLKAYELSFQHFVLWKRR
jgi:hypothetical protein